VSGAIDGLHHIAHVVDDLGAARDVYQRLGFAVPPPAYYALPDADGELQYVGAANTHVTFAANFIELITAVDVDGATAVPSDAKVTQLQAPPEQFDKIRAALGRAGAMISGFLERFQGLHILALHTADVEAAAARLTAAGVAHGGVSVTQREVETPDGPRAVATRFLELDGSDPARPNLLPEGRIAIAESVAAELLHGQDHLSHRNGAVELDEVILCVGPADLDTVQARYAAILNRAAARLGAARVFHLDRGTVALVPAGELGRLVPGAVEPPTPGYAAYAVAVADVVATAAFLDANGIPATTGPGGELIVAGPEALGTTIVFRSRR
jgi:hypothetical protein